MLFVLDYSRRMTSILLILCFPVPITAAMEFDLSSLSLASLKLLGSAMLTNNGTVYLTGRLAVPNSAAGKAIYSKPIAFRGGATRTLTNFSTSFSFSVTNLNPSSIGGGLAFVISPDAEALGAAGGFLGLLNGTEATASFIAVEFDTLRDVELEDINGNHVGLDLGRVVSLNASDLGTVGIDLKSGISVNAWIEYDGLSGAFRVFVSYADVKPEKTILSLNLDLDPYLNDFMFVGFSGSTEGSTEIHTIESWSFTSSFGSAEASPPPSIAPSGSESIGGSYSPGNSGASACCGPGAVAGVVTASAFIVVSMGSIVLWLFLKRKKKFESVTLGCVKMPREFSHRELRLATRGFHASRIIGRGAFGTVYRGLFHDSGELVAVKRFSHSKGKHEFATELSIIGGLRHRNLLQLKGWCHHKHEILLVFDLMQNGSLDKVLHESRTVLSWQNRRKILLGVSSALAYLHQECENQVIHRDVKSSNIMLDEEFNARLGDFGLARRIEHDRSPDVTLAAGTMGYLAPEYLLTGRATAQTDVFSYGALVLEVATGKRPIEKTPDVAGARGGLDRNLADWVWRLHREERLVTAADPRLDGGFEEDDMRTVLMIGLACSNPDPSARPSTRAVVQILVGEASVPTVPKAKPTISFSTSYLLTTLQESMSDSNGSATISASSPP